MGNIQKLLQRALPLAVVAILCGLLSIVGIPFNLPVLNVVGGIIYVLAIASARECGAAGRIRRDAADARRCRRRGTSRCRGGDQGSWGTVMAGPGYHPLLAVGLVSFAAGLAIVDLLVVLSLDIAANSWGGIIPEVPCAVRAASRHWTSPSETCPVPRPGLRAPPVRRARSWSIPDRPCWVYVFSWVASIGTRLFLGMRMVIDKQSTSVIWMPGSLGGSTLHPGATGARFAADDNYTDGTKS